MSTAAPRRSLAPITNTRQSLGPQRASKPAPRQSLAPAAADRRSLAPQPAEERLSLGASLGRQSLGRASLGGGLGRPSLGRSSSIGGATAANDPRPINDKAYRTDCIRNLITFLSENGYNEPLSPKLLTAPTNRDFVRIFQFLYRKIDPNYAFGDKAEEEIPLLFKQLRYPFAVQKSAIFSCGSPHNWPKLLAALTWLVELASMMQLDLSAQIYRRDEFDGGASESEAYFDYLTKAYSAWLIGDEELEAVEQGLASDFVRRQETIAAEQQRLEAHNEALRAELKLLTDQPSPLIKLQQSKADCLSDIQKFKELIAGLTAHTQKMTAKRDQCVAELKQAEAHLAAAHAENARLKELYEKQDLTAEDVERLNSARIALDEQMTTMMTRRAEAEKRAWKQEIAQQKCVKELEEMVDKFNALIADLGSHAAMARALRQADVTLRVDTSAPDHPVAPDIKSHVGPVLRSLHDQLESRVQQLRTETLSARDQITRIEDAATEKEEDLAQIERSIAVLEQQYLQDKEAMEAESKQVAVVLQELDDEILQTRQATNALLGEESRCLEALRAEAEQQDLKLATERQHLDALVRDVLEMVVGLKERVHEHIESLKAALRE